jgi:hypothetical protein
MYREDPLPHSKIDWADLDSRNERLVDAALRARLAPVTTTTSAAAEPEPQPSAAARPGPAAGAGGPDEAGTGPDEAGAGRPGSPRLAPAGRGRHRRTSQAAAAVVTAAAAALAIPVSASAALAIPVSASAALATPASASAAQATPASASAAQAEPTVPASWKIVKATHARHGPNFTAITASSPGHAWAFETFQTSSAKPVAWHLSGSAWSTATFPGHAGEHVAAAGSSSAGDVWAITSTGTKSRALHWNGSSWAATGSFPADIDAVTVRTASDVWVFASPFFPGHGGAWHYNGHHWARSASGNGLTDGSALGGNNVWAVGGRSVAHWNGHGWSRTSLASLLPKNTKLSHSVLVGIFAQAAGNVWAVGTGGRQDEGGPTVLLHYNGHHWSKLAQLLSSNPSQVIPDGSGGLWIPVPSANGIAFQLLRFSAGHLHTACLPVSGHRLNMVAMAAIPHSGQAFGAGFQHRTDNLGARVSGAILQFKP